jgi:hypothetical protein
MPSRFSPFRRRGSEPGIAVKTLAQTLAQETPSQETAGQENALSANKRFAGTVSRVL